MVGHGDVVTTARTYTHVVASEDSSTTLRCSHEHVLELPDHVIALQFGHRDGGEARPEDLRTPGREASPASVSARRSGKRRPRPSRSLHL